MNSSSSNAIVPVVAATRKSRSVIVLTPEELRVRDEERAKHMQIEEYDKRKRTRTNARQKKKKTVYAGGNNTDRSIVVSAAPPKKRRRCGGKAAGKFKTSKTRMARNKIPPEVDENGRPTHFVTDHHAFMAAQAIALPLDRLLMAYPELPHDPVSNMPPNFPEEFKLPSHAIVQNVVATFSLGNENIMFQKLVADNPCFQFNPSTFAAATKRTTNPDCTALAFQSGSMVSAGTDTINASCHGAVNMLLLFTKLGVRCSFHNFYVQNIVASSSIGFPVRLVDLAAWANANQKYVTVRYEPTLFPGLTCRVKNSKIVFLVFLLGKLVITGARSPSQISYMLTWFFYTILVHFYQSDIHQSSADYRISQTSIQTEDILRDISVHDTTAAAVKHATGIDLDDNEVEFIRNIMEEDEEEEDDLLLPKFIDSNYTDVIATRRAQATALAEESVRKYGSDFGLYQFLGNNANLVWWDQRMSRNKREEDMRWYTAALADPHNIFNQHPPETPMVVNACKYLSLQVMRVRHRVHTGSDEFDPSVMDMLLECAHDDAFRAPLGGEFKLLDEAEQKELFSYHPDRKAHCQYWENDEDEAVRENLRKVYLNLAVDPSKPTPTWEQVAGNLPRFPVYKRKVCNMYNADALHARQAQFLLYE